VVAIEPLERGSQRTLLEMARKAILTKVKRGIVPTIEVDDAALQRTGGAFVSLHIDESLRGCIGTLQSEAPLHRTVVEMAVAASTNDTRFPPLALSELRHTMLEISVLTPMKPSRPEDVVVGTHGIYLVQERRRGVLLPQVAVQHGWNQKTFLEQGCQKAGIARNGWRHEDTMLFTFEATVFSDMDFAEEFAYQ
jgi:AmmeMemoRadiSam system protein A